MREIEAFFEAYRRTGEEGASLAPYYHAPCLTLRADGSFVSLQTEAEVAGFFRTLAETYRGYGWVKFPFLDFSAQRLGGRSAFASMRWQARKDDGSHAKEWSQSYNLASTVPGRSCFRPFMSMLEQCAQRVGAGDEVGCV